MAIYVREARRSHHPCVTRARSAMSTGFIMTTQTIRIRHPYGVRASGGAVRAHCRRAAAPHSPCGRPAPLPSVIVAATLASPRRVSCRVVSQGVC
ncbi:hypothetical protein E2P84_22940 [Burkholderia cepacia]|uniref:Uncharacterized protein n=1 Tax=Burkholderia cepacia TaxID=292 RepID=A0AAX2RRJ5_BURCE|nr:hypothetical protein E2P84_22940 [Burkholderia cepacia]TET04390.1 hypothetical protein E3D36_05450 [Burkholderia cepacia]TEU41977.1 hypothetical protein E3D39_16440 [Burkholderia cepacia]TEU46620.1 hypothetical protein E3D38_24875 [Burkholderia cepacia]TEU48650.1 hypothetical protein E3D37_14805 [Burkholderia cepacia]